MRRQALPHGAACLHAQAAYKETAYKGYVSRCTDCIQRPVCRVLAMRAKCLRQWVSADGCVMLCVMVCVMVCVMMCVMCMSCVPV